MAITIEGGILDALQYHLSQVALSPARPISWPGMPFTPQTGTPYLAVNDFPTDTITRTVENNGTAIYEGFLQVSAFWPVGEGLIGVKDLAGQVAAYFKRGTVIQRDGTGPIVRIERAPVVAAPIIEPAWVQVPTTIYWQSYNKHPA